MNIWQQTRGTEACSSSKGVMSKCERMCEPGSHANYRCCQPGSQKCASLSSSNTLHLTHTHIYTHSLTLSLQRGQKQVVRQRAPCLHSPTSWGLQRLERMQAGFLASEGQCCLPEGQGCSPSHAPHPAPRPPESDLRVRSPAPAPC